MDSDQGAGLDARSFEGRTRRAVLDAMLALPRRPLLVGIDGQGGSGKSTLARDLAAMAQPLAVVVEGDDFYRDIPDLERQALDAEGGYRRYFDWERLRSQVLDPVRRGDAFLAYQRYDWHAAELGPWHTMEMPDLLNR